MGCLRPQDMNHPPSDHASATCDGGLNFCLFGPPSEAEPPRQRPNTGGIGVVTLASDGTFISRRPLNDVELAQAWAEHDARHGLAA